MTVKPDTTAASPSPPAQSYAAMVWHEFCRSRGSVVGLIMVIILFLIALFAPFIAGRHPLVWAENGAYSSPLLTEFFAPSEPPERILETTYNITLVFLLMSGIALALSTKLSFLRKKFRYVLLLLVVLSLVPFALSSRKLDVTPYRAQAINGDGNGIFPLIPYGVFEQGFGNRIAPTWYETPTVAGDAIRTEHLLGTDNAGRDVLVRIIHGARVSLAVGLVSVLIATSIGVVLGAIMGYFGGWTDNLLSRFTEVIICFPTFFLILTVISIMEERSILNIMLVIGLFSWTGIARLVRGEVLKQRSLDYVTASIALGARPRHTIFRHILPNAIAPVFVSMTLMIAGSILTEAGLSFLGFGVDIPTASWGELLNQAREAPTVYWWLVAFPGAPIFWTVTIYNLVGEGLRDAMDPRLRRRAL